jgi:hypothetical protein
MKRERFRIIKHAEIVPGMRVFVQGFEYVVGDVWGWITGIKVIRYAATLTSSERNKSLQNTGYANCTFGARPDIRITINVGPDLTPAAGGQQ